MPLKRLIGVSEPRGPHDSPLRAFEPQSARREVQREESDMRIVKSPQADADLDETLLFISRQSSIHAALSWLQRLDKFLRIIARTPGIGTARDELLPGARSVAFGAYLTFSVGAAATWACCV
jgi:plasmid stabilization system protein ParE